ncbi:MAG TPA: trehalase family glycosidase [Terracidiphilus sp.]|nr:trehalase family glycosidase [Terracidiphilus sp.]
MEPPYNLVDRSRRNLVGALAGGAIGGLIAKATGLRAVDDSPSDPKDLDDDQVAALLRPIFTTDDPAILKFATEAYTSCVLGKIRPPDPPLAQAWIVPGGGYYAQWLWDTMFVVDLLSILSGQKATIRGVFQNYWDFQQRWNKAKPAFMHGMIANFMAPFDAPKIRSGLEWETFPAYSQAPLLAWGMERVYERNHDAELLRMGLQPLEQFHEWYWRERDVTECGLIGVGAYSGDVQHARYETYDREVDLDGLSLTRHPHRPADEHNGAWYGDILIPANTSYLLLSELSLARMAITLGDHSMAERRRARYAVGASAMRSFMWSQQHRCFVSVRRDTLEKVETPTVGGFMPLMAQVPTSSQASAMDSALAESAWSTQLPIPTVARTNPRFVSGEFWRGDVWPATNYQVAKGLATYGHRAAAARIADETIANALKVGISERYDSFTGAALGVKGLGMSATMVTMMLDGLSHKYQLSTR